MASRTAWTRNELVLTLTLYHKLRGKIPDTRHPEVDALATNLADLAIMSGNSVSAAGRSKASIIYKLSNFRSLDPQQTEKGLTGFSHVGKADKELWKEFQSRPAELAAETADLLETIESSRADYEPLKANIRLLRLVGDELIGSLHLAVFELVKNAYDADAAETTVTVNLSASEPEIIVQDNGTGMNRETIRKGWLQLGGAEKRGVGNARTDKGRMPLGEKGIGRLAAFKLGDVLTLVTKEEGADIEYEATIDLSQLLAEDTDAQASIEDIRTRIQPKKPERFPAEKHGTWIRISKLRHDPPWDKRQLRQLHRLMTTLINPFKTLRKPEETKPARRMDEFNVALRAPGREDWLKGLLGLEDIIDRAIYRYRFSITADALFRWRYEFVPPSAFRSLSNRTDESRWKLEDAARLDLKPADNETGRKNPARAKKDKILLHPDNLKGIGPLSGELLVFDRRREVLKKQGGESNQVRAFLDEQTGVRVYRDGIRVFNYGEGEDDWLGLNRARVNKPGEHLATNVVIAAVELDAERSRGLEEKTNREGFDENGCFLRFRRIVDSVVGHLGLTRQQDRELLDRTVKKAPANDPEGRFDTAVEQVRSISRKKGLEKELGPKIDRIIKEYKSLQDAAMGAAAGLNLAIIFHETERALTKIIDSINRGENIEELKKQAAQISLLLEGFSGLFKHKERSRKTKASRFLETVRDLHSGRFDAHRITFSCPVLTGEDEDFSFSGPMNYYLAALSNLIDNAIFWTRREREEKGDSFTPAIVIRTAPDWAAEGPSIVVIDNGPGFTMSPEFAVRAFQSNRAGGMGIGLYFANVIMEANDGNLHILDRPGDLGIDTQLDGAAVALRFRRVE